MKYKLIAMDFDDTLLNSKKEIGEKTKECLKKYKEKGYKIVGVTARALLSAKKGVPFDLFDYLILNNGCNMYDVGKNKEIVIGKLDTNCVSKITKLVDKFMNQVDYVDYISGTTYYSYKKKKSTVSFIKNIHSLEEIKEEVLRMNIFLKDWSHIVELQELINQYHKDVNCFIMQDSGAEKQWLVVNPKGIDKKLVLESLGKQWKIGLSEMIFFGDGLNDLVMMESVGCSVAMGNSLEVVKKKANYVTLSNDEDGIAVFLDNYLQENKY